MTPATSSASERGDARARSDASSPLSEATPLAVGSGEGNDETIPRTFLALTDAGILVLAFLGTGLAAPLMQTMLLEFFPLWSPLPEWMSLPEGPSEQFPALASVAWVLAVTAPLTVFFMEMLGGYRQLVYQSRARLLITTTLSPIVSLSLVTFAFFALKNSSSSRVFIFTFGLLSVFGLATYRAVFRSYKKRRLAAGFYAKNVLLVGRPSAVRWMAQHFRRNVPSCSYQLCGWLTHTAGDDRDLVDLKSVGRVEDLGRILINSPIHEVIAVQSSGDRDWLKQVIEDCDYFRVKLRIVPEALLIGSLRDLQLMFRSEPLRLPEVVLAPPHLESDALFLKRVIDIVVAATLLVALIPLFLVIIIGIKLTTPKLPVLYPWRVIGLKGKPFTGYKFTTMVADADHLKNDLMDRNEMTGPVFKIKDDPRITPLGKFLRRYSINELPQLWSVLRGDMSLVGPRPAGPHELVRYELWHKRKLCVQPGITCLWQVSGRNRISNFDEWVRLDLEYIDKWSLWLDFRILARTAWAVLGGSGS